MATRNAVIKKEQAVNVRGSADLLIVHLTTLHWTFVLDQLHHIIFDCFHA